MRKDVWRKRKIKQRIGVIYGIVLCMYGMYQALLRKNSAQHNQPRLVVNVYFFFISTRQPSHILFYFILFDFSSLQSTVQSKHSQSPPLNYIRYNTADRNKGRCLKSGSPHNAHNEVNRTHMEY